jgi:hypothetical protein
LSISAGSPMRSIRPKIKVCNSIWQEYKPGLVPAQSSALCN